MKLITKQLEKRFGQIGPQDGLGYDAIVVIKFFDPIGTWNWYATEFDPERGVFFGFVTGDFPEWGTFSLADFIELNMRRKASPGFKLGIERDMYCAEQTLRKHLRSSGFDMSLIGD